MTSRNLVRTAVALSLCALLAPMSAAAQGNGRGNAFGHGKGGSAGATAAPASTSASSSGSSAAQPDGNGVRNFGSWLDDASVMGPGNGFTSFSAGYWRTPGFTEFDVPAFDVAVALTRRVQVGASLPIYHASEPGGPISRGVGDLYLTTKVQLRDPAAGKHHRVGFSITPMLEILSVAPVTGASRINWAVPLSIELQRDGWRTYGSTGYFSRGSLFASGAFERALSDRAWITGTISQSYSIKRDDLSEALGLAKTRVDVSGGGGVSLSNAVALFGAIGRTISKQDATSSKLFLTGGLSVTFAAWQP